MNQNIQQQVQRVAKLGKLGPRKSFFLDLESIRPIIRIAHQMRGPIYTSKRIILDYELVLILQGNGVVQFPKEQISFKPHQILLVPPFIPHQFSSGKERCNHIAIHFDWAPGVPRVARSLSDRPPYEIKFPHGLEIPRIQDLAIGDRIDNAMMELLKAWSIKKPLYKLQAESILLGILTTLFQRIKEPQQPVRHQNQVRIERAIAFVEAHLLERIKINDMAKAAKTSTSHLVRLFGQYTGLSPMEFLRRKRIHRAKELMANIDLSIKEISAQCGFDDPYHFSRVFRQIDGISPSRYRDALLLGVKPR